MSEVYTSLDDPGFVRRFSDFRHTAYRLETLQEYDVTYEMDAFDRFRSGESRGLFPGIDGWCDMIRQGVRAGKRFQRVHVVVEPLSDYVRFECAWAYRHNVEAGEDVRIIPVKGDAWPAGLPRWDYWLFDSVGLVEMRYRPDGTFASAETVTEESRIAQANEWRESAVRQSTGFREYAREFDALMRERRT